MRSCAGRQRDAKCSKKIEKSTFLPRRLNPGRFNLRPSLFLESDWTQLKGDSLSWVPNTGFRVIFEPTLSGDHTISYLIFQCVILAWIWYAVLWKTKENPLFFFFSNCCLNEEASDLGKYFFCVFLFLLGERWEPFLIWVCLISGDSKIKEAINLCKYNFLEYSGNSTD